ncbi:hypothetical protein Droror1_Dr00000979 [Drosera rotundifolia]
MESDQAKIFIGGIPYDTTEETLRDHFSQYGDVLQISIMKDKITDRPRGFGFLLFADLGVVDTVLADQHTINGRTVDVKRALSKDDHNASRGGNTNVGRNMGSGGNVRTKKIFVGGLPPTLSEDGFHQYFESYGHVTDVVIMYDQSTQRPRGFGFISFDTEEAVERVLHKTFHDLDGKQVEVKRALPKDSNSGISGRSSGGGGGGYQGYGSGGNPNAYDGRMDSRGYMQSQSAGGAYGQYGSSGYGAAAYGYGAANNGMGYGGFGGYGGYGANPGYGAPGGAYGNPNAASGGRGSWNAQNPSGYGAAGYGNTAGYGNAAAWGAGAPTGAGSGTGQSPNGASGYGTQGYGYGNYGGGDGSYGNQGGYGTMGGRPGNSPSGNASAAGGSGGEYQDPSGGYIGGGYGDASGQSGYGSGAWRSDQAAAGYGAQASGQAGYGSGYGGSQARQGQQQ